MQYWLIKTEQEIIQKTDVDFFKKAWNFVEDNEGAVALIHYFKKEVKIPKPEMFKAGAAITDGLEI